MFLNAFGTVGSAVITRAEQSSAIHEDGDYLLAYEAVMTSADGREFKTGFNTLSVAVYPRRNAALVPLSGERFAVKCIPGVERNIVMLKNAQR
jgi:hypothetical protein